ncbi:MAG: hypothetical protein H7Y88_12335 [Phycisphaerales bacterium]|nr:hypothetical protein [Phycisphaerales bacterium]
MRWNAAGEATSLSPTLNAIAHAVNGNGTVVAGHTLSHDPNSPGERAIRWTTDGEQLLVTLGGTNSHAFGVSDDGTITVGDSDVAGDAETHAVLWTTAGLQDLGTLGGSFATAYAISGDGLSVVGTSDVAGAANPSAFLWKSNLGMVDLNTYLPTLGINLAGWTLTEARGISFDGSVITGSGLFDGQRQAFVVTGIPAPGTALVLFLGGGILVRRRGR